MTRVWRGDTVVPVTKVEVGPCAVVQVKTRSSDGYDAVQVGYGSRKEKNIKKPQLGQMKGLGNFSALKEFRYDLEKVKADSEEFSKLKRGDRIDIGTFVPGDVIEVSGISKGKGFQGVVKRHGFHGHNTSHGTKDQVRMPGSIGAGEPQHVFKGTRMAGRMGGDQVTVKNLEVIEVNKDENSILIKGGLPGARNSLVTICGAGELKLAGGEATVEARKSPEDKLSSAEASTDKPVETAAPEVKAEKIEGVKEAKTEVPAAKAEEKAAPAKEKSKVKQEEKKEVKDEKKEEVKTEKLKPAASAAPSEQAAADKKTPEDKPIKPKEQGFEDKIVEKYKELPKAEKEKLSSPEVMAAIAALEETYKADLVSVVTGVVINDIAREGLADYLVNSYKLEKSKADQIAADLEEKVFKLIQ